MTKAKSQRRKIGILGCAIPTLALTPFNDDSWELWAHGQQQPTLKRWDAWFELHNPDTLPPPFQEHLNQLQAGDFPIYGLRPTPWFPDLICIDREKFIDLYTEEPFTSTVSWMMAHAIHRDPMPEEIGLWGVEMCSEGEYYFQRAGCKFFEYIARSKGIKITIPAQSDLARVRPPYPDGDEETLAMWIKDRHMRTTRDLNVIKGNKDLLEKSVDHHEGALEILDHLRMMQGI